MDFIELTKRCYKNQHKAKPKTLTSVEEGLKQRIKTQDRERRSIRQDTFITNRMFTYKEDDMDATLTPQPQVQQPQVQQPAEPKAPSRVQKVDPRKQLLLIWQEEKKAAKLNMKKERKRPPFKVGVVRHNIVPFKEPIFTKELKAVQGLTTRVTRATTRAAAQASQTAAVSSKTGITQKSFAPSNAKFNMKLPTHDKKVPAPSKSKQKLFSGLFPNAAQTKQAINIRNTRSKVDAKKNNPNIKNKAISSDSSQDNVVTSSETEKSGSSSDEVSTPIKNKSENCVTVMSPFVTVGRGKSNSRRETISKQMMGYSTETSPEKTAQHLRLQLDGEIARLQALCQTWRTYEEDLGPQLTEGAKDLINLAIGQTQLLIRKKFEQFRGLITQCEERVVRDGEGIVTVQDLQGFWDMVFMQVVNVDLRFNRLTTLKERNWQEDDYAPVISKPKKTAVEKSKPAPKNSKSTSGLKAMILAARMKSKQNAALEPVVQDKLADPSTITFNGGFFSITSPSKPGEKATRIDTPGKRISLLKNVVSAEAKKRLSSSVQSTAIMRASRRARVSPDDDLNGEVVPDVTTNDLNKTPGKGILKTPGTNKKPKRQSLGRRSTKVLFMDDSTEESDCEVLTKSSTRLSMTKLSGALSDIDTNTIYNLNKSLDGNDLLKTNSSKKRKLSRGNAVDYQNSPSAENRPYRNTRSQRRKSSLHAEAASEPMI